MNLIGTEIIFNVCEAEGFQDEYTVTAIDNGYIVRRTVKNISDKTLRLKELKSEICGISFDGESQEDYYYGNENARLFCNLSVPLDYQRLDDSAKENKKFALPWIGVGAISACKRVGYARRPISPFPQFYLVIIK